MAKAQLEIVLTDAGGSAPTESEMHRRVPVVTPSPATTQAPARTTPESTPRTGDTQPVSTADTQVIQSSPATRPAERQPETTVQAAWMAAKEIAAETSMGRLVATIDRMWTKLQRAADMLNPQRLELPQRQAEPAPTVTQETAPPPVDASATVDDIPPVQQTEIETPDTGAVQTAAATGRAVTQAATAAETTTTAATTGAAATEAATAGTSAATVGAAAGETAAATGATAAAATGLMAVGVAVGAAGAAVVAGFGLAAMASKALSNALEAQASTMAAYSASVADATAATELSQEAANMRRADALGPELSEFERERAAIESTMADAMTSIYRVLLVFWNILEPLIWLIAKTVEFCANLLEAIFHTGEAIFKVLTVQWVDAWNSSTKATKALKDAFTNRKDPNDDPLDNSFANQFKGLGQAMADRERPGKRKANGGGKANGDPLFVPDKNRM